MCFVFMYIWYKICYTIYIFNRFFSILFLFIWIICLKTYMVINFNYNLLDGYKYSDNKYLAKFDVKTFMKKNPNLFVVGLRSGEVKIFDSRIKGNNNSSDDIIFSAWFFFLNIIAGFVSASMQKCCEYSVVIHRRMWYSKMNSYVLTAAGRG